MLGDTPSNSLQPHSMESGKSRLTNCFIMLRIERYSSQTAGTTIGSMSDYVSPSQYAQTTAPVVPGKAWLVAGIICS